MAEIRVIKIDQSPFFEPNILGANPNQIHQRLQEDGLILFRLDVDRPAFVEWFERSFDILFHPDSGSDGITEISASGRQPQHGASSGFTTEALPLHTDGSAELVPPVVLGFLVVVSGTIGGQTVLSDGLTLLRTCRELPYLGKVIQSTSRAFFRGREFPIFDSLSNPSEVILRFRQDGFLSPSVSITEADIGKIATELDSTAYKVLLNSGEGYLLHNHRWAHGRDAFEGSRIAWRLLGAVRQNDSHAHLNRGFLIR